MLLASSVRLLEMVRISGYSARDRRIKRQSGAPREPSLHTYRKVSYAAYSGVWAGGSGPNPPQIPGGCFLVHGWDRVEDLHVLFLTGFRYPSECKMSPNYDQAFLENGTDDSKQNETAAALNTMR